MREDLLIAEPQIYTAWRAAKQKGLKLLHLGTGSVSLWCAALTSQATGADSNIHSPQPTQQTAEGNLSTRGVKVKYAPVACRVCTEKRK